MRRARHLAVALALGAGVSVAAGPGARPLLVGRRLVDPDTGRTRAVVPGVPAGAMAIPRHDGTGHLDLAGHLVDGATGRIIGPAPGCTRPQGPGGPPGRQPP